MLEFLQVNQALVALIGTIFGGAGFKLIEWWLNRSSRGDNTAKELRTELRTEVYSLRDELRKVETDLDSWRAKYYDLMEQFLKVKADLEAALRQIRGTAESAEETLKNQ